MPEAVHLVGAAGEPAFATGASNSGSTSPAGFYKDGFGLVHLQGTVETGTPSATIFTLPAGYRPGSQIDYSVPAFAGATFTTNRATIRNDSPVFNDSGTGTSFVSLDGITFRATQ